MVGSFLLASRLVADPSFNPCEPVESALLSPLAWDG